MMSLPGASADETYTLAEEALIDGRTGRAVSMLRHVVDRSPRAAQSVYLLGVALFLDGRSVEARRVIDQAYRLKPWVREPSDEIAMLRPALRAQPVGDAFPWVDYQLALGEWFSIGLSLDAVIESGLASFDIVVVQVGANDGQSGDPIARHISDRGWRGLLLEPQSEPFELLRDRYRLSDRIEVARCGIADYDGTADLYVDGTRSTLGSLVPDRNALRDKALRTVVIDVATFGTLFGRYGIDRVDVLQIDTEGYDYQVLRTFDFAVYRPAVVNMEFYCLSIEERLATFDLLRAGGYGWAYNGRDLLAVRRAGLDDRFCLVERSD